MRAPWEKRVNNSPGPQASSRGLSGRLKLWHGQRNQDSTSTGGPCGETVVDPRSADVSRRIRSGVVNRRHGRDWIVGRLDAGRSQGTPRSGATTRGSLTVTINERRYGRLLAKALPRIIRTPSDNERALAIVESLMEKGAHNLTPEEGELLDLLVNLVRDYEATAFPPREKSKPHKILALLWNRRGLAPKDLMARAWLQERRIGNPGCLSDDGTEFAALACGRLEAAIQTARSSPPARSPA